MATYLFIDGENFKGKIRSVFKDAGKQRPAWHDYDFKGLIDKVLNGIVIDRRVFYFARIKEHQEGKGGRTTSLKKYWKLIYYEGYLMKDDAIGREKFLKSGSGRIYLKKQLRNYLNNPRF